MKKLRVLFLCLIIAFAPISARDFTPAEEDCFEEVMRCLMDIDITSEDFDAKYNNCMMRDYLCMFFAEIDSMQ